MFNNTERERELELNFGVCVLSETYVAELRLPSGKSNMAMENGLLIRHFRIKTSPYRGLAIAIFDFQRVSFELSHLQQIKHCKTVLQNRVATHEI